MEEPQVTKMLEPNDKVSEQHSEDEKMSWLDTFRWMPREFRDWIANDGLRMEEVTDDEGLVIRAEVPGVDPNTDIDVSVADGCIAIGVRRREAKEEHENGHRRSEFRYGNFYRRIPLPDGAKTDEIVANYGKGILNVRVPLEPSDESKVKVIPIAVSNP